MGATQSSEVSRSDSLLQQLAGGAAIEYQDVFFKELFLSLSTPLSSWDPAIVDRRLSCVVQDLLRNNASTWNFQALVLHTVSLLHDVKAGKNRRSAANAVRFVGMVLGAAAREPQASAIITDLFEIPSTLPIPRELVVTGSHQLLKILVRRLMSTLADIECTDATYIVHFECITTLLLLASSQLAQSPISSGGTHTSSPLHQPAVDALLSQQAAAPLVMQRLLNWVIGRPAPPKDGSLFVGQPANHDSTVVKAAKTAASSLWWLPGATLNVMATVAGVGGSGSTWPQPLLSSPLADLSLLLLLALVHTRDHPPVVVNPFKLGITTLSDAAADEEPRNNTSAGGPSRLSVDLEGGRVSSVTLARTSAAPSVASVRFPALFETLATLMCSPTPPVPLVGGVVVGAEEGALFGYQLLHGCQSFKDYVLSRTDVEVLLLPVLRQMYSVRAKDNPSFAYMLQVWLLILSQDTSFATNLHRLLLPTGAASWYKEQLLSGGSGGTAASLGPGASGPDTTAAAVAAGSLARSGSVAAGRGAAQAGGLTLGSLLIIVLVRTVATNFGAGGDGDNAQPSDLTLPTNALAALANLAPHISYLHSHAAQRLLSLTQALAKRYGRLSQKLAAAAAQSMSLAAAATVQPEPANMSAWQSELAVLEDYLRVVLEVLNAALLGPHGHHHGGSQSGVPGTVYVSAAPTPGAQLARNAELVYALLHKQEVISALRGHARLGDLVANLLSIIEFFNQRLDDARSSEGGGPAVPGGALSGGPAKGVGSGGNWSVERVLGLVSSSAHYWQADRLRPFIELRFVYEEEGDACAFFVPYLWGNVRRRASWLKVGHSDEAMLIAQ